jgi:hypothetical protein
VHNLILSKVFIKSCIVEHVFLVKTRKIGYYFFTTLLLLKVHVKCMCHVKTVHGTKLL